MTTQEFSEDQKNMLAEIAEHAGRQPMDLEERGRFDQNLDEGALVFTGPINSRKPSAPERKKLAALGSKCHKLADEILTIFEALQRPVDVKYLLDLEDRLQMLAKTANTPREYRRDDWRLFEFVYWLGSAWEIGARRPPGTSTPREGDRREGPFVEFVRKAGGYLDTSGAWESRSALGETIKQLLKKGRFD